MKECRLSQDGLKILACLTMLADHIGAVFVRGYALRVLGRISFPIFCYLLTQGVKHTHDVRKYALRLLLAAVLSEFPYDMLFYGEITWRHQNVLFTLLIALAMLVLARGQYGRPIMFLISFVLAEGLCTDYGGWGIALVALLAWTESTSQPWMWRSVGMTVLFLLMPSAYITFLGAKIPIQLFAMFSLIPIGCCNGKMHLHGAGAKWVFYLFYPLHLFILLLIKMI